MAAVSAEADQGAAGERRYKVQTQEYRRDVCPRFHRRLHRNLFSVYIRSPRWIYLVSSIWQATKFQTQQVPRNSRQADNAATPRKA